MDENSIFEIIDNFDNSQSIVLHVCQKYQMESITLHHGQCSGQPHILNDRDQSHLARIFCGKQYLLKILSMLNSEDTRYISRSLAYLGYGYRWPTRLSFMNTTYAPCSKTRFWNTFFYIFNSFYHQMWWGIVIHKIIFCKKVWYGFFFNYSSMDTFKKINVILTPSETWKLT